MLITCQVKESKRSGSGQKVVGGLDAVKEIRSLIPAVTHVDYSCRLQTVERDVNPLFYDAIAAFFRKTGCPVVINTSFNVRGEPIVCSPLDAFRCFIRTDMDCLLIGSFLLRKEAQQVRERNEEWKKSLVPD